MSAEAMPPARRRRIAAAAALAAAAMAVFLLHKLAGPDFARLTAGDLGGALEGARRIQAGEHDIYARHFGPYGTTYALEYPLTASLFLLPLAPLPPVAAGAVFVGLGTGLAAFALSRRGWTPLLMFASAPAVFAWVWAQWSPWLLLQGIFPAATLFLLLKPQVALAMFAYRPEWRMMVVAAGIGVATLLWSPTWPLDWLGGQGTNPNVFPQHAGALLAPGGPMLLLAALRWRDPRARLLLVLAVIPNRLWFYEQLLLGYVPQTRNRMLVWVACTWVAVGLWAWGRHVFGIAEAAVVRETVHVVLVYGPALYFVLRPSGELAAAKS